MNKIERVAAVLEGRRPDRTPVSFWCHFAPDCAAGAKAVEAHVRHVETYDLDFLKVMDDIRYPRLGLPNGVIADAADLDRLTVLRDDWVDTPENGPGTYDRLARPGDLATLAAAREGSFNILHVCGTALDFARFAAYPVHVLHWADRLGGPSIAEVAPWPGLFINSREPLAVCHCFAEAVPDTTGEHCLPCGKQWHTGMNNPGWARPALCAGLDNLRTMVTGSPDDCEREVRDAIQQAGTRPILIAPGCTFDPAAVPAANLQAIRRAVAEAPVSS